MSIATKANVRTTQAARTSLAQALKVSFNGGTVMGLGVAGLAVVGLSTLFIVFLRMYVGDAGANGEEMMKCLEVLAGFSLGARSSRCSPVWAVASTPRPPTWVPISWVRWKPVSLRMTRATLQRSPIT